MSMDIATRFHRRSCSADRWAEGQMNAALLKGLGIAAAVLLSGYFVYSSVSGGGNSKADSYQDIRVFCTACKQEFGLTAQAAAKERAMAGNPRKKLTCPNCKKEAGENMTLCGKCNHWYLPKNNDVPGERKCSKCGHDPDQ
jgi:hypothetical protein